MASSSDLVGLIALRAEEGSREAFRFLQAKDTPPAVITYLELYQRASTIRMLIGEHVRPGAAVIVMHPPGLEFVAAFLGCLLAGVIAVPSYAPKRPPDFARLRSISLTADARCALTTASDMERIGTGWAEAGLAETVPLIATDLIATDPSAGCRSVGQPGPIAYLQFTSGSTGAPKGAMITHDSLWANLTAIKEVCGHDEESRGVFWLPPYHDLGLVGGILQPVFAGYPCTLMAPATFVRRPTLWLRAISDERATTAGGPNFAFEHCLRIPEDERAGLDLSSWEAAFVGSEPVRADSLAQFATAFAPYGFRPRAFLPCYGLAEATLLVSGGPRGEALRTLAVDAEALSAGRVRKLSDAAQARLLVGCGQPISGHTVRIVDPDRRVELGPDQVGEIWVQGPSVAAGYFNQDGGATSGFGCRLATGDVGLPDTGDVSFLATGDLGFLDDGVLYVTGRRDDLIIIRGRNYYPQDLERTVERAHPAIGAGRAMAFVAAGADPGLVILVEIDPRAPAATAPEALTEAIRLAVAEAHELAVAEVVPVGPGTLPRSPNGKVQRRKARQLHQEGGLLTISARGHGRTAITPTAPPANDAAGTWETLRL